MNYEPSHRKPPRQERWPNATPGEGWPAYQQGDDGRAWESAAAFAGSPNGYAGSSNGYGAAGYGYDDARGGGRDAIGYGAVGYGEPAYGDAGYGDPGGYAGTAGGYRDGGYGGARDYYQAGNGYDGWDGRARPGYEFAGSADHLAQDEYPASSVLVAPDTIGEWWQADRSPDGDVGERGPAVGAMMGVLAAAVAIGVATLAAAFVRPQASPVSAVGGVLFDRIPAALKSAVMAHLGAHGQAVLLLGGIGLIAMVFGCLARRDASVGVAGIAAFGLLAAFVVITRPESRASDVIPSAVGGLAGIMALLWLARASAPAAAAQVAAARVAYSGGGRRRAR